MMKKIEIKLQKYHIVKQPKTTNASSAHQRNPATGGFNWLLKNVQVQRKLMSNFTPKHMNEPKFNKNYRRLTHSRGLLPLTDAKKGGI